jgi:hypothetical protein
MAARWGETVIMRVSNDVFYAKIQEYGGTIVPKKGRYLAIPIGPALTKSGVPRFPGGPRTVQNLTFIARKGRNPLLAQRRKGGGITPFFVLVRSVMIPPRLGFRFWFGKTIREQLPQAIRRALSRGWKEAHG